MNTILVTFDLTDEVPRESALAIARLHSASQAKNARKRRKFAIYTRQAEQDALAATRVHKFLIENGVDPKSAEHTIGAIWTIRLSPEIAALAKLFHPTVVSMSQ